MNTIAIILIIIAFVMVIGSFSTFHKSARTPIRKKGLNDLQETLPRTNKTQKKTTIQTRKK